MDLWARGYIQPLTYHDRPVLPRFEFGTNPGVTASTVTGRPACCSIAANFNVNQRLHSLDRAYTSRGTKVMPAAVAAAAGGGRERSATL